MQIEKLSIKTATIAIFIMIAIVAIVLSVFAGDYFRKSALDAQMNSLSRVIEVASQEMLKDVRSHTFDLGMKLGGSTELIEAVGHIENPDKVRELVALLDDPFINGFVGVSKLNMVKLRVYDLNLRLLAESSRGISNLGQAPPAYLRSIISQRQGVERLKAVDGLWNSVHGPLYSTVVPIGGLWLRGYLEVVIDPVFNMPDISKITKTPVDVFSVSGEVLSKIGHENDESFLPVEFNLLTSDGESAFLIIGYEDVATLNEEMEETKIVTIGGFLLLSMMTLLFALWLFNRFLFVPVSRMVADMGQMAKGNMEREVDKIGLREFYVLADSFNAMANQVKARTNELRESQNRLLHLLDLDENAILYFASDNGVVYFNKGASDLFGYSNGEINDLEFSDLFIDDVTSLLRELAETGDQGRLQVGMQCLSKTSSSFQCDAIVSTLNIMGESGYAVVLRPTANPSGDLTRQISQNAGGLDEKSTREIEQSLKRIVEIASDNPALLLGINSLGLSESQLGRAADKKALLRENAVAVMSSALACWETDLGKTKVDLADESAIWPVYIDKSTPTTRTLDKYLHIDTCPKNPRCQRVVDTAEFVLRQAGDRQTSYQQKLMDSLESLRQIMSGI